MDERERYEQGLAVRRAVLGNSYVEAALARRTELNHDFQDLLTRYVWGEVWDRPGLPRNTRSLLTIAMLVALNRPEELRLHLLAAANNGVTGGALIPMLTLGIPGDPITAILLGVYALADLVL